MDITVSVSSYQQKFRTAIVGVTYKNDDGTDRQTFVKKLKVGDMLNLVREPSSPHDRHAIAVHNQSGDQLGYLPAGDLRLASHLDMGGEVSVEVIRVIGGKGILGLFFKPFQKPYGCVVEITKGSCDWKKGDQFMNKSNQIETVVREAHALEIENPAKALNLYREAINSIIELDSSDKLAAGWRRVRYPINRVSMLLEKAGDYKAAYDEIVKFETYNDIYGLTSTEQKIVSTRKNRLLKKLNMST